MANHSARAQWRFVEGGTGGYSPDAIAAKVTVTAGDLNSLVDLASVVADDALCHTVTSDGTALLNGPKCSRCGNILKARSVLKRLGVRP